MIALSTVAIFTGCNKGEEGADRDPATLIPESAFLLYTMRVDQVMMKMEHENLSKLNSYQMMLSFAEESEKGMSDFIDNAIKDPSTMGIDPSQEIMVFVADDFEEGWGGMIVKISDMEKFQAMLDLMDMPEMKEDKDSKIKHTNIDEDLFVFTDGYYAVFAAGDDFDERGMELGIGLFSQGEEGSVKGSGKFSEVIAREDDMVFAMNFPESLQDEMTDAMDDVYGEIGDDEEMLNCLLNLEAIDFDKYQYFYTLNFNKGDIALETVFNWDEIMGSSPIADMIKPFDASPMSSINSDEALASMAMGIAPDEIQNILDNCGVTEMVDGELGMAGLSMAEITGWFGGNIYMNVSSVEMLKWRELDYWAMDDDGKAPTIETDKMLPVFLLAMDVRDQKGMTEFVELLEFGAAFSDEFVLVNNGDYWTVMMEEGFDIHFGITEDMFYLGNKESQIAQYVGGTYPTGSQDVLGKMNGEVAYIRIDTDIPPALEDMIEDEFSADDPFGFTSMAIKFAMEFDYLESRSNFESGSMVLKLKDDSHYSLYQIIEMADDASPI